MKKHKFLALLCLTPLFLTSCDRDPIKPAFAKKGSSTSMIGFDLSLAMKGMGNKFLTEDELPAFTLKIKDKSYKQAKILRGKKTISNKVSVETRKHKITSDPSNEVTEIVSVYKTRETNKNKKIDYNAGGSYSKTTEYIQKGTHDGETFIASYNKQNETYTPIAYADEDNFKEFYNRYLLSIVGECLDDVFDFPDDEEKTTYYINKDTYTYESSDTMTDEEMHSTTSIKSITQFQFLKNDGIKFTYYQKRVITYPLDTETEFVRSGDKLELTYADSFTYTLKRNKKSVKSKGTSSYRYYSNDNEY